MRLKAVYRNAFGTAWWDIRRETKRSIEKGKNSRAVSNEELFRRMKDGRLDTLARTSTVPRSSRCWSSRSNVLQSGRSRGTHGRWMRVRIVHSCTSLLPIAVVPHSSLLYFTWSSSNMLKGSISEALNRGFQTTFKQNARNSGVGVSVV